MKDIKTARKLTILSSRVITPGSNRIYVDIAGRRGSGTRFRYQGEITLDVFRDIKLKSLV